MTFDIQVLTRHNSSGKISLNAMGVIMPLLDHFHSPIHPKWPWESFHSAWATEIMKALNSGLLPPGYLAFAQVHFGERTSAEPEAEADSEVGGFSIPLLRSDCVEVRVAKDDAGGEIVATIQLVSPRNKNRRAARRLFVAKCVEYLWEGVGVVVADIVTSHRFNVHDEIMHVLGGPEPMPNPSEPSVYAVAYKPERRGSNSSIKVWVMPLQIGDDLPVAPLGLKDGVYLPLDLEPTYLNARTASKL